MLCQKLAAVCCAAINELDTSLYDRLKLLLSSEAPIFDNMVQEAALKSTAIIVRRYLPFLRFQYCRLTMYSASPRPQPVWRATCVGLSRRRFRSLSLSLLPPLIPRPLFSPLPSVFRCALMYVALQVSNNQTLTCP